ncbi:DUF3761 domain-containing protein [Pseudolysobacter antarcticus]|uniref:DUF3761 domain-containing protein n=1 Tax=Pseudolysobacter antarcticus TaxID=2511995 RepID=A0A411HFB9_9GAMM|nr:DUF3761 domain-containing protein [Pseudolysobacter antarcticus]QBB69171.1 DUF3761 domain-containing protein [Pseudolysobacter antarcticus]
MKAFIVSMTFAAGLFAAVASYALAPPSTAPAGSTGLCKDGSYYSGASKRGACSRHGGVKDWYGAAEAPADATPAPAAAAPAPAAKPAATPAPVATPPAAAVAPAAAAAPAAATKPAKPASKNTLPATAAAGGGPGKVWVNTSSKVYHCSDDRYYGKTKKGEYMTEADAKASGARAEHGKECTGK